ncbi:MAG TPA: DoxX family protein [Ktedonobacterales bacterium]|nr:DoxX family protein [Ktedonobacterales bacterium]
MHYDIASLILRACLGVFFVISGAHKLLHPVRRAELAATFKAAHVYNPAMMLAIPLGELAGGSALLLGFATPLACLGLILICTGACVLDGLKRISTWKPLDKADYIDDVLYLPEVLYVVMMLALLFLGSGKYSLDTLLFPLIRGLIFLR